ncbi:MAG: hypothetical protein ACOZF2_10520 [Thermodesulfobacteriota bacterium]
MDHQRVVIIGAVALGPKTACRLKRLRPDFQVTMVDQGEYISYSGCGIPYYIVQLSATLQEIRAGEGEHTLQVVTGSGTLDAISSNCG